MQSTLNELNKLNELNGVGTRQDHTGQNHIANLRFEISKPKIAQPVD